MPKRKEPDSIELMLARALYRADKWDPARDVTQPFAWEELRAVYLQRANRLTRTFEKDGLQVTVRQG